MTAPVLDRAVAGMEAEITSLRAERDRLELANAGLRAALHHDALDGLLEYVDAWGDHTACLLADDARKARDEALCQRQRPAP